MAATFNFYQRKLRLTKTSQAGFVLVTAMLVMLLILSLAIYATSFTLTERRIASSQKTSVQTYYLAEAGVAEAIWKLKNDSTWKTNFEDDPTWAVTTTRSSALYPNGSYTIHIQNTDNARGVITVTANLNLGTNSSRRVIEAGVYKAITSTVLPGTAKYSANGIDINNSKLYVTNGGMFSNNNTQIMQSSVVRVNGSVRAVNNLIVNSGALLYASSTADKHDNPAPTSTPMPAISVTNSNDPDSYKSMATRNGHIYSQTEFSNLLAANQGKTLTLNGVIYVTGSITIKGSTNLVINGALVAENSMIIGQATSDCCSGSYCNGTYLTINRLNPTDATGIISMNGINFQSCLKGMNVTGLIYTANGITFSGLPNDVYVTGAIIGGNGLSVSSVKGIYLTYDNPIVLGSDPQFSPIVTVDHWEEEY